jgi:hypothetical protein
MKLTLSVAAVLFLAAPVMAAPGDPRAVRGNLEWPAVLSAEPFIVVRGDDGRLYYADVARARRMTPGTIAGAISLVGIEGNQSHEIGAVVVGAGDSALSMATPPPAPAETAAAPSSLPQQAIAPRPAIVPPVTPPPAAEPAPPKPAGAEDMWQVSGRVMAVTPREFVVETRAGEAVHVDVSRLSAWTRDAVRAGDQVKLFGVPQKDDRLVANGFIQEVPSRTDTSR